MTTRDEARAALALDTGVRQSPGDWLYPMSARVVQRLRDAVEELLALLDETEPALGAHAEAFRGIRERLAMDDVPVHVAADIDQIISERGGDWGEPTPDEREALGEAALNAYLASLGTTPRPWKSLPLYQREAWIAAGLVGFHRQGPITDDTALPQLVDKRDPECVKAWPECESFGYDPRCCRFPKSCSAGTWEPVPADTTGEQQHDAPDNSRTHCKECREGKHGACDGSMYVEDLDVVEACGCAAYDWNGEHTNGGGR